VLIIVKHGDVEKLLEPLLDEEALRCLDVFQVDPAEGGAQCLDDSHDVVGVPGIDLDVEHVDICEPFEQQRFALHHRLGGRRSDIPKPQHGGPVAHHRHQVSLGRVRERLRGVRVDPANGFRDAGRVGQGKVTLRGAGFGYLDCNLPRTILLVVLKRVFAQALHNHPPRVESRTATPSRCRLTLKVSPPFLTRHRVRKVFRHVCVLVAPCFIDAKSPATWATARRPRERVPTARASLRSVAYQAQDWPKCPWPCGILVEEPATRVTTALVGTAIPGGFASPGIALATLSGVSAVRPN